MRKKHNHFDSLVDNDGIRRGWDDGLQELITNYFENLFSSTSCQASQVLDCVEAHLLKDQHKFLEEPFSATDMKNALFSMC